MNAVEFITELGSNGVLVIPQDAASRMPTSGTARVIVLIGDNLTCNNSDVGGDALWHDAAYRQFLADDDSQDDVYEACR
jgi:hypothetical protein